MPSILTKRGTLTNQEAMRWDEICSVERSKAETWTDEYTSSLDSALDRKLISALTGPAPGSKAAKLEAQRRLPRSHSLPTIVLPSSSAAARLQGGWQHGHIDYINSERRVVRHALRRSREALKLQRLPVDCSSATGHRPYSVRWQSWSAEHPRSSMPYKYGNSLHAWNAPYKHDPRFPCNSSYS